MAVVGNEAAASSTTDETSAQDGTAKVNIRPCLNQEVISKLRFRELQSELSHRELPTDGTTGQLRDRLREAIGVDAECVVDEDGMGDDCVDETVSAFSNACRR